MLIGEAAALAGVSTRTVRYYHQVGLVAEPPRRDNGYRDYRLRDVVLLLRARRLTELGLSLAEVATVLAEDGHRELRDILVELDADLARHAERIAEQRARIRAVLDIGPEVAGPAAPTELVDDLARLVGEDDPTVHHERVVLDLVGALPGVSTEQLHDAYRRLFADPPAVARAFAAFSRLADADQDDPAVAALAREVGPFMRTVAGTPHEGVDEATVTWLRRAVSADLAPAQARCLELVFAQWKDILR